MPDVLRRAGPQRHLAITPTLPSETPTLTPTLTLTLTLTRYSPAHGRILVRGRGSLSLNLTLPLTRYSPAHGRIWLAQAADLLQTLLTTYYQLLAAPSPAPCSLLYCSPLTTHCALLPALLLTTYYSLLTAHYLLLTTHYALFTAYCLLHAQAADPSPCVPLLIR